ncbi:ArsR/SmtB family transcription factor [Yoonia maricola]|nr:winged helix-turn-helix domain-containing protein [Yoonia maricola]
MDDFTMTDPNADSPAADITGQIKALSSPYRLQFLEWLMAPRDHFSDAQNNADLVEDGVCVGVITEKAGLSQPTVTSHMQRLAQAGFVTSKKIKNWVYYRPDQKRIDAFLQELSHRLKQR